MTSLRRRLRRSLLTGVAAACLLGGAVVQRTASHALEAEFDAALAARAGALGALLELDGDDLEFDYSAQALPEYEHGADPAYFALFDGDGREITRSPTLTGADLPPPAGATGAIASWDLPLPDGRPGRAASVVVAVGSDDGGPAAATRDVTVVVARSRVDLDGRRAALLGALLSGGAAVLALVSIVVAASLRRGLGPLERLASQVAAIDEASLDQRLDPQGVPDELLPVTGKLNDLLARLEGAFGRQRRMTAAMAHELRTPIAELRTASDLARRWPVDGALLDDLRATAAAVARRMGDSVDAVMRYCRIEAGQERPDRAPVVLRDLAAGLWAPHAQLAAGRGLLWRDELPAAAVVPSDRALLALLLGNLLANAAAFGLPGLVRIGARREGPEWAVEVSNACAGLTEGDLGRLGEPFWRKDPARSGGEHSGLGLALARAVAGVLGGRLAFALRDGRFLATLHLPGAPGDAPPQPGPVTSP